MHVKLVDEQVLSGAARSFCHIGHPLPLRPQEETEPSEPFPNEVSQQLGTPIRMAWIQSCEYSISDFQARDRGAQKIRVERDPSASAHRTHKIVLTNADQLRQLRYDMLRSVAYRCGVWVWSHALTAAGSQRRLQRRFVKLYQLGSLPSTRARRCRCPRAYSRSTLGLDANLPGRHRVIFLAFCHEVRRRGF